MSKKTLNAQNLAALGADRLAELLIDVSTGSADIKRRLRLELSHNLGPQELGRDVRKRLVTLRRSQSNIGWRKRKAFVKDLQTQAEMITARIAPDDAALGFDLLWQFLELAPAVFTRTDDKTGEITEMFDNTRAALGPIAERALLDPEALADRIWNAVSEDGFGTFDGIIATLGPALGTTGFGHLKAHIDAYEAEPLQEPDMDHEALAFLRALRSESGNYHAEKKARLIRNLRQDIAEAEGDTDAVIAQYAPTALLHPGTAAEIATLLMAQNRIDEALEYLDNARPDGPEDGQADWDAAYITCLLARGDKDAVQAHRWQCFETRLDVEHLRAHLAELPDFDDVEAEDRARQYAQEFPEMGAALAFLTDWPDHPGLATLVLNRPHDLLGLSPSARTQAAEALRLRFPLAAVLVWRSLIVDILNDANRLQYGQAADHLADCAALDGEIEDYLDQPDHTAFLAALQTHHRQKTLFWKKLANS